ncbi:hypothetical protein CRUP_032967, partial [Coryphaenoides rupestris]
MRRGEPYTAAAVHTCLCEALLLQHEATTGERHPPPGGRAGGQTRAGGETGAQRQRKCSKKCRTDVHGGAGDRGGDGDHAASRGVSRDPLRVAAGGLAGGTGLDDGVPGLHALRGPERIRRRPIRAME